MDQPIRIGISSCLLGGKVRYDGQHKLDHYLTETLGRYVDWVPVCPEVEMGLPVPREAMRLVGDPGAPRLVTIRTGLDQTDRMRKWSEKKLKDLHDLDLSGFIFKSRSPSSGMERVKVYTPAGMPSKTGSGLFASAFMKDFPLVPVEEDGRLHDPALRENFIERVFVFHRWKTFLGEDGSRKGLVEFHASHKLLIMAHSRKHLRSLGKIVASAKSYRPRERHRLYLETLMQALALKATVRKNVNVMQHIMGYFKKQLSPSEKKEMLEVIADYHKGLVPQVVPMVLFRHYVLRYDEPYLKRQVYLNPHPMELMLRNHV